MLLISWRLAVLVILSRAKMWEYSILSRDLALPALHRLHSVISDFRPPSGTEFGEAALQRLLVPSEVVR